MRHQQEFEREEKKRLKSLVLNLDLRADTDADGIFPLSFHLQPNPNVRIGRLLSARRPVVRRDRLSSSEDPVTLSTSPSSQMRNSAAVTVPHPSSHNLSENESTKAHKIDLQGTSIEKSLPNPYTQPRVDRAGKGRASQRGRQLQVSDLDWYDSSPENLAEPTKVKENSGVYHGRGF
jgi:hypothetical protein